ncbi:hypothetical protein E2C01_076277 [Portunus trituberculatus]|uniref:Uncharacterized protein n=1 Tax=Portunus trituberculatus TaxID=210409 RepID=A0A5B7III1_PORTR|nr:hypothetical protein [Portunus trituberculatus]
MVEKQHPVVQQRRNFAARKDPLEMYDDRELITRYRLDRDGILFVTDLIRDDITSPISRNSALSAELKVVLTLRILLARCNYVAVMILDQHNPPLVEP